MVFASLVGNMQTLPKLWMVGAALALGLAQSPWNGWGIYADSTGNGASPVHGTQQCPDTFWLVVDTNGMGAAGITGWRWYLLPLHQVVYAPSLSSVPAPFPAGGLPDRKVGIQVTSSATAALQVYYVSGDSALSHKTLGIKPAPSVFFTSPSFSSVICPGSSVSFSLSVSGADSFYVQYGSNPSDTVKNRTQFTLTAPSSGSWVVTVYAFSCGFSISNGITFNIASPSLSFISLPQEVCPGDSVSITLHPFSMPALAGVTSASYVLKDPANNTVATFTSLPIVWTVPTTAMPGSYSLQVSLTYACGTFNQTYPGLFTVYGPTSLTAPSVGFPTSYCPGSSVDLSVSGAGQIQWDIDYNGTWDYTGNFITHVFPTSTTFPTNIRIKQDVGCFTRVDTLSWNPTNTSPNPSGSIWLISSPVCPGGRMQVGGSVNNTTYIAWTLSWAGTVYGVSPDTSFQLPSTSGTYAITPTLHGCGAPTTLPSVTVTVPASSVPFIPPPVVFGAPCQSTGGEVRIVMGGPAVVDSVLYILPDGTQQKRPWSDTLVYAVPAGVSATSVLAVFDFGCGIRRMQRVPISTLTAPAQVQNVSLFPALGCPGTNASWSVSGASIQSVDVYLGSTWVSGAPAGGGGAYASGNLTYPSAPGSYTYMFVARGCGGNDTAYQTVTVQGSGVVASFTAPGSACVGQPVTFTGPSSSPGVTNVFWNFGDGTFLNTFTLSPTHTYTDPGTYTVFLTLNSSCGSSNYSQSIKVYGGPPLLSGLNVVASGASILYSVSATSYDSVKWFFGDGNSALGLSGSYTYAANGTYTVRAVAYNACGTDTLQQSVTIAAASLGGRMASAEGWVVYPNPAQEVVWLSHSTYRGPAEVRVLDVSGRLVRAASLVSVPGELRVSGLPTGLYSVHLRTVEGVAVLRLMVE